MTLAALEATLRLYQHPETLVERLPTLRLLTRDATEITALAQCLQPAFESKFGEQFTVSVEACLSQIGSGSLPVDRLSSAALTFTPKDSRGSTLGALTQSLRELSKPIIGRISDGRLRLDLRCLEDETGFIGNLKP
ncbi:L-seryl-tRNA(Sec) selenium transferase [Buttiauxella gaviniae ATCC 51604]|uniref:L-seryl-tRNA(Sec) selenium transferase n=1 Tax=Buttiauxella gaviniae ATCC 51604 TaxID=1354253 RepID=A0A1B7I0I8_9ENTR|nr:L-seryl-tRNA(Sec) selenium transferase [Buttiauxella gaviniae ATCC 51604]